MVTLSRTDRYSFTESGFPPGWPAGDTRNIRTRSGVLSSIYLHRAGRTSHN
jgi:hypothetical protein